MKVPVHLSAPDLLARSDIFGHLKKFRRKHKKIVLFNNITEKTDLRSVPLKILHPLIFARNDPLKEE